MDIDLQHVGRPSCCYLQKKVTRYCNVRACVIETFLHTDMNKNAKIPDSPFTTRLEPELTARAGTDILVACSTWLRLSASTFDSLIFLDVAFLRCKRAAETVPLGQGDEKAMWTEFGPFLSDLDTIWGKFRDLQELHKRAVLSCSVSESFSEEAVD